MGRRVIQCKYAYLFRIILVVILFIFLMILCFYILSMCYFYFQMRFRFVCLFSCVFRSNDQWKRLGIGWNKLESKKTQFWKNGDYHESCHLGQVVTESFCNESAPWDDSAQGLKDLEDSGLSSFSILGITSSTDIQMK